MLLMERLGITIREIDIKASVLQHFEDIGHDANVHDSTYENAQARERTQILMDLSNQLNGLVIGTGDLSELALGWCTYNGDHMSMYAVNCSIPKTLIQYLVRYAADTAKDKTVGQTLIDIVDTPISPELTPADNKGDIAQKTEDLVGPYELMISSFIMSCAVVSVLLKSIGWHRMPSVVFILMMLFYIGYASSIVDFLTAV